MMMHVPLSKTYQHKLQQVPHEAMAQYETHDKTDTCQTKSTYDSRSYPCDLLALIFEIIAPVKAL
jgi:hypothetical protein